MYIYIFVYFRVLNNNALHNNNACAPQIEEAKLFILYYIVLYIILDYINIYFILRR